MNVRLVQYLIKIVTATISSISRMQRINTKSINDTVNITFDTPIIPLVIIILNGDHVSM